MLNGLIQQRIFKKELMQAITDGIVCFNANNEGCLKMYNECKTEKILCGINSDDCFANIKNIKTTNKGSTFTLEIDKKSVNCTTKLLGIHNLEDVVLSAGLAYKLGVT